jgi:hypothetical protein
MSRDWYIGPTRPVLVGMPAIAGCEGGSLTTHRDWLASVECFFCRLHDRYRYVL